MKPLLIAFTGSMGSGKSTAIKIFNETIKAELVKFAGPLYDIQEYIYKTISPAYTKPKEFIKDRFLLQWLGTSWGRNRISPTLWVDLWKNSVDHYLVKLSENVICDDCRFDNEAEVVKSMNGIIIKIVSSKISERIDTLDGISNHVSESGISSQYIDYVIENNGTLEEFKTKLNELISIIRSK